MVQNHVGWHLKYTLDKASNLLDLGDHCLTFLLLLLCFLDLMCNPGCCSVLVAGLFLWSAATAATALPCLPGLVSNQPAAAAAAASGAQLALLLLLGARGLMGLASAAAMPCVTAISAQLVPASHRGSAVSFVYACFNAGGWVPRSSEVLDCICNQKMNT
jgi:MFS family permease